ncbi:MAG TPA: crotonase/enoyl-CoA hydratase family protein [Dehalococcoidia bacterium]|jgi:enoyl-CoA hydratase|nr:crotonase/enoyl-CoA hydratase family protein [Dehalococcoidia bacterium]
MTYETILYEPADGIARITLNRPEKLNAISWQMQQELQAALWEADRDPAVHAVTLQGAGRSFSAGYDIEPPRGEGMTHAAGHHTMERDIWGLEQATQMRMTLWEMHKPVIAGIHGHCLAGGTDVAFLCDVVIAAEDVKIGYPPVRALGSPVNHMWTYLVGPMWAKRLLLTGDTISGAEAERIGLVLKAVPAERLDEEVRHLASRMALIDVDLLAAQKRTVNLALELMGARTMQRLATERDAIARQAPVVTEFYTMAKEKGLKAALEWRDSKFGDGRTAKKTEA